MPTDDAIGVERLTKFYGKTRDRRVCGDRLGRGDSTMSTFELDNVELIPLKLLIQIIFFLAARWHVNRWHVNRMPGRLAGFAGPVSVP